MSRADHRERTSPPETDPRPLMGVTSLGRYLEMSRWTIYRMIESGELPTIKVGGQYKFRPADIDDYLDRAAEAS